MENLKSCCIFGYPDVEITEALYNATAVYLANEVVLQGCRVFYFFSNGDFEALCRDILNIIKEKHPLLGIQKIFCTLSQEEEVTSIPYFQREDYDDVIEFPFGSSPSELYDRLSTMIDVSSTVICYLDSDSKSDFCRAYKYAKTKKNRRLFNLYDTIKSIR
ncbi:MAG: hypothetical protein IJD64_01280 [Clostridia bacterium]|nr:hypothetical protein [Clostridia bacterium]